MLMILCIILFRISCNFLHYAPKSMHYSQIYSQDYCENNPVTLAIMLYIKHDYTIRVLL